MKGIEKKRTEIVPERLDDIPKAQEFNWNVAPWTKIVDGLATKAISFTS